jgi:hypothetical protein
VQTVLNGGRRASLVRFVTVTEDACFTVSKRGSWKSKLAGFWNGPEIVIFSHWAHRGGDLPHCKGLDTGCVCRGRLTDLCWSRLEWVSVPARRC